MTGIKNLIQPLLDIGLSKYEAKVYLSLIEEGISTAKNISNITGIPYGKVYEIINLLSNRGFLMVLPSKPMKYRGISPQQAIIATKKGIDDKFERIRNDTIKKLELLFAESKISTQPQSFFSVINGRSNVLSKTEELIKKAEHNINIQCSANSLSRLIIHKEVLKGASCRGVEILIAGITNKENLEEINSLGFCNIKHINSSKNNFISIDGKECLVIDTIPDDDNIVYGRDLGIAALSCSFTKFVDNFFIDNFKRAREIKLE